ncbi:hypothetical protein L7F22_039340 [Adiantum nelumboides]|nr:hypothetical protein [Adiantum nelumboides]
MVQVHALFGLAASFVALTSALPNVAQPAADGQVLQARRPNPTPSQPFAVKRQQGRQTTGAFSAFSGSLPASLSSVIATITSGTDASVSEVPPKTTYTGGAQNPSISNAPPLPSQSAIVVSNFPALDKSPDPNLPLSQEFIKKYDLSSVPNIPITDGTCSGQFGANAAANRYWTCGGHTAPSDITACPDKNHWGLSYDDGPSPYTPQLLDYLESQNLKTTFFIVGSRALSRQDLLRYEYMNGHQLSVHTWSHPALTTQTNQQILLELAWTMEVIRQVTGVTPVTMRPPYGDIDDRVRAICKILGLTPIMWTSTSDTMTYDTNDWRIGAGQVSAASVVGNFTQILNNSATLNTGYIVLEHDLYKQSVELATEVVLPMALAHSPKQTLEPIYQCLGLQLGDSYVETNRNVSGSGGVASPGDTNPTSNSSSSGSSSGNKAGNFGSSGSGGGSSGASSILSAQNMPLAISATLGLGAFFAFFAL